MDVFEGAWTSFEHVPMLTSTCNGSYGIAANSNSEMQDRDWAGFLNSIEHENSTTGAQYQFFNLGSGSQGYSNGITNIGGLPITKPFSGSTSSTSSTITPPHSATQTGATWPASSRAMNCYQPTTLPTELWRPAHFLPQHQVTHMNHDRPHPQMPPTPQSAGFNYRSNLDQTLLPDSPAIHDNGNMHNADDLMYQSDYGCTTLMDDAAGNDGDDEADGADPCYAQLLYRCLKETPDHTMSLKELYDWIAQHSQKAKDPKSRGWQNSVRHNLSMNAAFEKAPANAYQGAKKGSLWRLTEKALREGVISTTRYRKDPKRKHERRGGLPALKRQLSGARGGQATRAAARRNRDMHHARSTPYPSVHERYAHQGGRYECDFTSPFSIHSERASPMPNMLGSPSPFFFRQDPEDQLVQLPSNPHTPPQLHLTYNAPVKPALQRFELQHIDYDKGGLFGDCDTLLPETPSLATEASLMSDDGMESLLSPIGSRETTIF